MEKRFIVAIALSLLVLLSWSAFVSKTHHIDNKEVKQYTPPQPPLQPETVTTSPPETEAEQPEALFSVSQQDLEVIFNEPEAAIREVEFKSYQSHKLSLENGLLLGGQGLIFKRERTSRNVVSFVHQDQTKKIVKRFIFSEDQYAIWLEITVLNLSKDNLRLNLPIVLGTLDISPKNIQARYQDITVATKEKIVRQNANIRKPREFLETKFISSRDRYFCAIMEPESGNWSGFIRKPGPQKTEVGLDSQEIIIPPGRQIGQKIHIYLGPQDLKFINAVNPGWSVVIHYGTFDFISQFLLQLLGFLHGLLHNWGWAIIALSLIVYFMLYPLTLKQMRSMKEMQILQPRIEELRKTYKDNPQKLNKDIMELYRQHKVNPFGGCLPLILQIPIFFALYQALIRAVSLKGARFLWIKDLSEPDRLFTLPTSLPILGNEVNILPILMAIGMFMQQKISMAKMGSGNPEQQKLMMILMPVMFGVIFYHMPSGLVLYWFINSGLMLIYQIRINRVK